MIMEAQNDTLAKPKVLRCSYYRGTLAFCKCSVHNRQKLAQLETCFWCFSGFTGSFVELIIVFVFACCVLLLLGFFFVLFVSRKLKWIIFRESQIRCSLGFLGISNDVRLAFGNRCEYETLNTKK